MGTLSCSQSTTRMNSNNKSGPQANNYRSIRGSPLNVQNCHELKSLTLGLFYLMKTVQMSRKEF